MNDYVGLAGNFVFVFFKSNYYHDAVWLSITSTFQVQQAVFLFQLSYKLHSRDHMAHSFLLCVCFSDDVFLTYVHKTQGSFLPQNERANAC